MISILHIEEEEIDWAVRVKVCSLTRSHQLQNHLPARIGSGVHPANHTVARQLDALTPHAFQQLCLETVLIALPVEFDN